MCNSLQASQYDIRQLTICQNLTDPWQAVTEWFDNNVPPATLLGVALLGYYDQLVEIDATIVIES